MIFDDKQINYVNDKFINTFETAIDNMEEVADIEEISGSALVSGFQLLKRYISRST
jgi:hypothetical protein